VTLLVGSCPKDPRTYPAKLGEQPVEEEMSPKTAGLLKRLRWIEELPPADQRAVLRSCREA
jgi:hypothetical protein